MREGNLLSMLRLRELGSSKTAQDINRYIRLGRNDRLQKLRSFFPGIGSLQTTLLLGFDKTGDFVVCAEDDCIKIFYLILGRYSVIVGHMAFSLQVELEHRLTTSHLMVFTSDTIVKRDGAILAVIAIAPPDDEDDQSEAWRALDGLNEDNRSGTVCIFRGVGKHAMPLLSLRLSSLSVLPIHHSIFRLPSPSAEIVFINNGAILEMVLIDCSDVNPDLTTKDLPVELLQVPVIVSQQPLESEHRHSSCPRYFDGFVSAPGSPTSLSTGKLRADILCALMLEKTYPNKQIDLADIEARVLGPAASGRVVLVVLCMSVLYSGGVGGKDLGCLCAVDIQSSNLAEVRALKWLDLRKGLDQRIVDKVGTEQYSRLSSTHHEVFSQSRHRSWLAKAADAWHGVLQKKDPLLRRLHEAMNRVSNDNMEQLGSLHKIPHPIVNVTVVHDEFEV